MVPGRALLLLPYRHLISRDDSLGLRAERRERTIGNGGQECLCRAGSGRLLAGAARRDRYRVRGLVAVIVGN
jgi:hypothetical protein